MMTLDDKTNAPSMTIKLKRPRVLILGGKRQTYDSGEIVALPISDAKMLISAHMATEDLNAEIPPSFHKKKAPKIDYQAEMAELKTQIAQLKVALAEKEPNQGTGDKDKKK
jgi:hypothetical protein